MEVTSPFGSLGSKSSRRGGTSLSKSLNFLLNNIWVFPIFFHVLLRDQESLLGGWSAISHL